LRDNKHFTINVRKGPVHFSLLILKYSEVDDFFRQPLQIRYLVTTSDSEQNYQSLGDFTMDLAVYSDRCPTNPLNYSPHLFSLLPVFPIPRFSVQM
jgi:hypothetical protein